MSSSWERWRELMEQDDQTDISAPQQASPLSVPPEDPPMQQQDQDLGESSYSNGRTPPADSGNDLQIEHEFSTPREKKHQDFYGWVPDASGSIQQFDDSRNTFSRLIASLFRGVPYGTYFGAKPEEKAKKRRPSYKMSVIRDDKSGPEAVYVYGFVKKPIDPGRFHIIGVRNSAEGCIEAKSLENLITWELISVEQLPAAFIRCFVALLILLPLLLLGIGIASSGSISAFFERNGDYLLLYTVGIVLSALYISNRIRHYRDSHGSENGLRRRRH